MSSLFKTVQEARTEVRAARRHGTHCPCCGKYVKETARTIHAEPAMFLCKLVRAWRKEPRWYTPRELIGNVGKNSTDASYLPIWGLLEKGNTDEDASGPKGGLYRPTKDGIQFVDNEIRVLSHAWVFNHTFQEWKGGAKLIGIIDCLGTKFDYTDLMNGGEGKTA